VELLTLFLAQKIRKHCYSRPAFPIRNLTQILSVVILHITLWERIN